MNVFVIGIGLIGGSMVMDIKNAYNNATVFGIDTNDAHLEKALELGVIDEKSELLSLGKADIVIVSIPVDVQLTVIPKVLDLVKDDALVIDVGSTKEDVCLAIENHAKEEITWLHPIAETNFLGQRQLMLDCLKERQILFVR